MSEVEKKMQEILSNLRSSVRIQDTNYHQKYHKKCLEYVTLKGLWLEFGVYRGRSICTFADNNNGEMIFGFDSFEGLPEFWDPENPQGVYSLGGQIPAGAICGNNDDNPGMYSKEPTKTIRPWPKNVTLIKGLFQDTLDDFLQSNAEIPISFIHLDCDLYSSSKFVLDKVKNRFRDGTILLMDDIVSDIQYSNNQLRSVAEYFLENSTMSYEAKVCQDFGSRYIQGCIKICEVKK